MMREMDAGRLRIVRLVDPSKTDTLAEDVRRGLLWRPRSLPPKHFYDEAGSLLFEKICDLPEYYPTRTEQRLLEEHAAEIATRVRPRHLVELGSGSSRKTRVLLSALGRLGPPGVPGRAPAGGPTLVYHPIEIDETILARTARDLVVDYPWLAVEGIVADFEHPIPALPRGSGVLLAILGGTIGNFERPVCQHLLERLAQRLGPGASLLIGTDMVKDPRRLHAAYNDAQGVTAQFNLNLLRVLNRKLAADFGLERFEHLAFYDPDLQQIEMHLRCRAAHRVRLGRLGLTLDFEEGETIRTEISRKFTPESGARLLEEAGWRVLRRFAPPSGDYCLWLASVPSREES